MKILPPFLPLSLCLNVNCWAISADPRCDILWRGRAGEWATEMVSGTGIYLGDDFLSIGEMGKASLWWEWYLKMEKRMIRRREGIIGEGLEAGEAWMVWATDAYRRERSPVKAGTSLPVQKEQSAWAALRNCWLVWRRSGTHPIPHVLSMSGRQITMSDGGHGVWGEPGMWHCLLGVGKPGHCGIFMKTSNTVECPFRICGK